MTQQTLHETSWRLPYQTNHLGILLTTKANSAFHPSIIDKHQVSSAWLELKQSAFTHGQLQATLRDLI